MQPTNAPAATAKYEDHGKFLGHGAFGTVHAVKRLSDGLLVARKIVRCDAGSPEEINSVRSEIELLQRLDHKNVLKYLDSELTERAYMYIYTEYCNIGDLSTVVGIIKRKESRHEYFMNLQFLESITLQLTDALIYLHYGAWISGLDFEVKPKWTTILHRDIKPSNVFLALIPNVSGNVSDNGERSEYIVKLGDFGASFFLNSTAKDPSTYTGTKLYWAPEICEELRGNNNDRITKWSKESDMWAAAKTVLSVVSAIWPQESPALTKQLINDPDPPTPGSEAKKGLYYTAPYFFRFLHNMINPDPSRRYLSLYLSREPYVDIRAYRLMPFFLMLQRLSPRDSLIIFKAWVQTWKFGVLHGQAGLGSNDFRDHLISMYEWTNHVFGLPESFRDAIRDFKSTILRDYPDNSLAEYLTRSVEKGNVRQVKWLMEVGVDPDIVLDSDLNFPETMWQLQEDVTVGNALGINNARRVFWNAFASRRRQQSKASAGESRIQSLQMDVDRPTFDEAPGAGAVPPYPKSSRRGNRLE